ncbi:MAG: amino acid ABC transporter ATP-binding protein, partial [Clostridia bacterium]|nr:amino acid ABC transporter ATP-binding protein [Clostridia bacterium]
LRTVGLAEKALNYPDELSGGQKQRIAIARTLAMNPDVILLDEPTSALDPTMVGEVQAVIRDLAKSGKTMLIVTHEMSFARAISNRVFYMDEGGIYEDGTPEQVFDHPQKELTRRFIRKLKILELLIDSRDFDFIGAGTQIDLYCLQNDIPSKEKHRIRLVIEELVQQILLAEFTEPDIRVTVEYAPEAQTVSVFVDYAGERFDPHDTDNDLSLKVLAGIAQKIDYTFDDSRGMNHVSIRLK